MLFVSSWENWRPDRSKAMSCSGHTWPETEQAWSSVAAGLRAWRSRRRASECSERSSNRLGGLGRGVGWSCCKRSTQCEFGGMWCSLGACRGAWTRCCTAIGRAHGGLRLSRRRRSGGSVDSKRGILGGWLFWVDMCGRLRLEGHGGWAFRFLWGDEGFVVLAIRRMVDRHRWLTSAAALVVLPALAQADYPGSWNGYGGDAQHSAAAPAAADALNTIAWHTRVDLNQQFDGRHDLTTHYGSPVITSANTIVVPVKTGYDGGFQLSAFNAGTASNPNASTDPTPLWTQTTDYICRRTIGCPAIHRH